MTTERPCGGFKPSRKASGGGFEAPNGRSPWAKMKGPLFMGVAMGAMMLWMAHGALTGEAAFSMAAAAVFVGAHAVMMLVAVGLAVFAARLSPAWRDWLARLHRPSLRHIAFMALAAAATAASVHVVLHGGAGWT